MPTKRILTKKLAILQTWTSSVEKVCPPAYATPAYALFFFFFKNIRQAKGIRFKEA